MSQNPRLRDATPAVAGVGAAIGLILLALIAITSRVSSPAGCYPEYVDGVIGAGSAAAASIGLAFTAYVGWRLRNWFHGVTAAGCLILLIGIVGQRTFSGTQTADMAQWCPSSGPSNSWSAHFRLPVLGLGISPIELAGLIVIVVGVCLVLLFERVGVSVSGVTVPAGSLDDADTI